jgi:hypothetical protein
MNLLSFTPKKEKEKQRTKVHTETKDLLSLKHRSAFFKYPQSCSRMLCMHTDKLQELLCIKQGSRTGKAKSVRQVSWMHNCAVLKDDAADS